MTFRADDLAPLLAAAGRPDVGFHSGRVLTWDTDTGANTIDVAGAVLADVPILNTGEAIALRAGHVVALLRFKSSYFILGRVTMPGTDQFASASVHFWGANSEALGWGVNEAWNTRVYNDVYGPAWADEVILFITTHAGVYSTSTNHRYLECRTVIDGLIGPDMLVGAPPNEGVSISSGLTVRRIRGDYDTNPVRVEGQFRVQSGTIPANGATKALITGMALFRATGDDAP